MVDRPGPQAMMRAAAAAAVDEVRDGMLVGLGTGRTAAHAIEILGRRVADGLSVRAVATSRRTKTAADAAGIAILPLDGLREIDLCIDGVDEIDPTLRAIKGGGGAMLIEKIVASMAIRNIAIADASKRVDRLGLGPLPVEVLPSAHAFVAARVARLGGHAALRMAAGAAFVTDSGHAILDCRFDEAIELPALAPALSGIPGVMGHGLFLNEIDALYLADHAGVTCCTRRDGPVD